MEHEIHIVDGLEMVDPDGNGDPLARLRLLLNTGKLEEALTEMRAAFERELRGEKDA